MTVKTIYIVRHGYRSNWLPEPYPQPPTGVNSDFPLAEHGLEQAKELAHYILSIGTQPEVLFSSPFFRCLQTSEPIADVLELPIYLERGIGEWYKPDREVIPEPASFEVLHNFFPGKLKDDWESTVIPSNSGETEEDIFERCKAFWPSFVSRVEERFPNVEHIMLVTHAATKIALGMNLLGFTNVRDSIDEDGTIIRSGACSLDKYELLGDDPDIPFDRRLWKMTMNGNTEFLSQGEEMCWDFSNGFEAGSDADVQARQAARITADTSKENGNSEQLVDDIEHVYVSIDLPNHNYRELNELVHTATMQYSGLGKENPLVKIGDHLYEGSWKKLIGTELAFPNAAAAKKKINQDIKGEISKTAETKTLQEDYSSTHEKVMPEKIYRIVDRLELSEVDHV
ncbi:HCL451Wp [Eremothecium sinecaudum]|uniref:HCL451Wp n=1 Tax=Eremothecium sinecaudum TaxID=45286 RepID=A0A109UY86_9SACH|nr:HCL451Wp [Eremothecium sinecaudum]AMD19700.1 HCL451Wp [Eremothecium sinecaudum]